LDVNQCAGGPSDIKPPLQSNVLPRQESARITVWQATKEENWFPYASSLILARGVYPVNGGLPIGQSGSRRGGG